MSTRILDHIVHLTPPGSVDAISAHYRTLGFHVTPGGTHADGNTSNALVALSDGVYLELIAFVHPVPPSTHRWARALPGWIDVAHLGVHSDIAHVINERAAKDGSGVAYHAGVQGGRNTPEGKTLKWRVTFPETKHGTGQLPFFCEDLTPRAWRVPEPGAHPSTTCGVSHIKLRACNVGEFSELSARLTTVLGVPPSATTPGSSATWPLETPTPLAGLQTLLILQLSEDDTVDLQAASGICEVGFWVEKGLGGEADAKYGKIVWTPVPLNRAG